MMVYTLAHFDAVVTMQVEEDLQNGKRW